MKETSVTELDCHESTQDCLQRRWITGNIVFPQNLSVSSGAMGINFARMLFFVTQSDGSH